MYSLGIQTERGKPHNHTSAEVSVLLIFFWQLHDGCSKPVFRIVSSHGQRYASRFHQGIGGRATDPSSCQTLFTSIAWVSHSTIRMSSVSQMTADIACQNRELPERSWAEDMRNVSTAWIAFPFQGCWNKTAIHLLLYSWQRNTQGSAKLLRFLYTLDHSYFLPYWTCWLRFYTYR